MEDNFMPKRLRPGRKEWWLIGFLVFFCLLFIAVELNNHRLWTNDFRVYYEATRDFFAGNDPYRHNYGLDTGYFKYAPFTLYLFSPVVFMTYGIAQAVHLSLLAFSLIVSVIAVRRFAQREQLRKIPLSVSYIAFLCIAIHVSRELHLGNINLLLLGLFCLGIRALRNGNDWQLILFWGLMLVLKPIMLPAVAPLLLVRKWGVVARMAGLGAVFFLVPTVHQGWSGNLKLWKHWLDAISAHNVYLENTNAVDAIVATYAGTGVPQVAGLLLLLLLLGLMTREHLKDRQSVSAFTEWSVVLAAFVPNFFVTDTEHFLLSFPLISLLLCRLRECRKWHLWSVFAAGMLCFSFHSTDLLGHDFSEVLSRHGVLGIGNLVFIGLFVGLKLRSRPVAAERSR